MRMESRRDQESDDAQYQGSWAERGAKVDRIVTWPSQHEDIFGSAIGAVARERVDEAAALEAVCLGVRPRYELVVCYGKRNSRAASVEAADCTLNESNAHTEKCLANRLVPAGIEPAPELARLTAGSGAPTAHVILRDRELRRTVRAGGASQRRLHDLPVDLRRAVERRRAVAGRGSASSIHVGA
jgi:hypothetical protein